MALLPTAKTLAQYFGSATICAHWEGDGLVLLTMSEGFDPLSLAVHAQVFGPYVLPFWFLADRL
jgi:hypothetical protein